ncbi:TonB-dependent receptor [Aquimarina sp. 2201CG14-23]|uniref:TonB-dependent receptor n=1 Tax=Aquimarina mycalae TaxID=3040073 RepID=UPI0024781357|nr:TonB-dependent receptor [Aquimarina sp. 2201CG14-23]MDH7444972.1 TonB-dependent receptor [Aquimarina sp. 2201CG14-23]
MSRHIKKLIHFSWVFACSITTIFAQDKDDETIETERVVIVKAYTPTISDAFKVKSTPVLNDSVTQKKKQIRYSIFSVPVASTFKPAKGRAANIDRPKKIPLYDNYATLGFGNFTSVLAEFYSNFQINRTDNIGLYLHHNSSQGGIEDVLLDDKFYNTFLDLNYTSRTKDFTYGIELGVEHQLYNWYGLPEIPALTQAQIDAIDPQQNYYGAKLGGKLQFDDLYFKRASLNYRFFGDALSTTEHHAVFTPTFEFEIADELITTDFIIDYLNGSFDRPLDFILQRPNNYSILNLGVQPNLVVLRDNLTLNLGASVFFSIDSENNDNDFFIYPKVTASYRLLEEAVIAYGGLEGGLRQNTYRDAVQANPYVSPTLRLTTTHNQFDAYVGLKGKISDVVSYNFRGGYISEDDKALFVNNRPETLQLEGYDFGNSFAYRYDDILTLSGYGEINFNINKKFKLGASAEYFNYNTEDEQEAWNLPEVKASVLMDYQITDQWFAGAQLFYVGERKDINTAVPFVASTPEAIVTLDSYFDANVNLGYRFNDKLSVFVKGNNLAGENYERWSNFPVQGIQVLGGITYKFNY